MQPDSINKEILKQVNELFFQAEEEEHKNNWNNAIEILKKAEKISLDKKIKEIEGKVYYKLGEIYQIAADFEKTKESVLNNFQLSISSFQKAHNVFKELKNEEKTNASLGFINLLKYISGAEEGKEEFLLESAKKCFNKTKLINFKKANVIDSVKIEILESRALELLIGEKLIRIDEKMDLNEYILEYDKLIISIEEEIKNQQDFSEIYLNQLLKSMSESLIWIQFFAPIEKLISKQIVIKNMERIEEFINIFEKTDKREIIFAAYAIYSSFNENYAAVFVNNQFEQKKYLKIAQKWLKRGEILLPKINASPSLALFYFTRFSLSILLISLGYFAKDFKHILDDLNLSKGFFSLYFPKTVHSQTMLFSIFFFWTLALSRSVPDIQRINFAQKSLDLIRLVTKEISIVNDPNYKIYNIAINVGISAINAILGDLIKDRKESSNHLQISSKFFEKILNYDTQKLSNTYMNLFSSICISRTGILLAKSSLNESEKVNYFQKAIDLLLESKKMVFAFFHIENLFLIGDIYYELGRLENDEKIFKKSYLSYLETIEYCKNKGYFNLMGSGYINLAKIEDRLGNFLSAAENYQKAIDSFDQAILTLTYTKYGKKIEKLKNYIKAWNLIEIAKSLHIKEEHHDAQLNYEQASQILNNLREYRFESPFYSAWAILEKAEDLSKKNKHQDAAATYLVSKGNFEDAIQTLNSYLGTKKSPEDIDRISKLIKVAEIRERYCNARHQIETARLESKKGNNLLSAELYNKAGSLFENLCQKFKIKKEKDELTAIFYLCQAWENMERADAEQKASLYSIASDLFKKASVIFQESRMKKLSLGNSLYCSALECGSLFDKTDEMKDKIEYYKKIKMYLRESSKNYRIGGFEQDAQWALATSTYFDGIWHLIQADYEIDHSKKNQYLNIATKYLNNALNIFEKAGYEQKKEDILNYLEMINNEKAILTSALNIIEKPAISASNVGISAPSCPIEISSSVNIEEMQRTDLQTESEMNWYKRIHYIYLFMPNGACIYDQPFKTEEEIEPHLVAGGLTGISALIQELTKDKTKVKIVEQEEMTILLEHGKYLSAALITEENLITLRNKLVKLIEEVEEFYQEELESYSGNIGIFSKVGKFIQKIFEN
ncbi:MAG: hypothetical protein ACFFDN_06110 [Candidatus Hodarchaeota archaeon]